MTLAILGCHLPINEGKLNFDNTEALQNHLELENTVLALLTVHLALQQPASLQICLGDSL